MQLTKKQFDILVYLERIAHTPSQRELARACGMSVGSVNKILADLTGAGMLAQGALTAEGLAALEPYRVKRAIFLAAGFGSRLVPVTLNTPKPLVRVKGTRMIDTLLDAVVAAGITEIYIVRGYLGEQFTQLLEKYPNITFLDNLVYNETNNISSAYTARHLLGGSYVLEADLLLYNPHLISKYQYASNYLAVPTKRTEDWCLETDSNGIIKKLKVGGTNCHHLFGISYFTEEDGARLGECIAQVYNDVPGGKELYWDQVAFDYHPSAFKIRTRACTFEDIVEIDTFSELKKIDPCYAM